MSQNQKVVSMANLNNNNNGKNHFLSISSKKKIDLSVDGKFSKSFKQSLSSSHSMRQKPKIFDPKQYKDFLKNQKIFIEMYYRGTLIDSGYEPYIVAMGGQVYKRLSPNVSVILTNHLTKQSLSNLNKRILKVNKNYIPIASILWLEQIYRQKKKVPKEQFLLTQDDIQDPQEQKNIEKLPDYFEQEIKQDLFADLNQIQKQVKVKNRFFHVVDKKNKKQVLSKLEQKNANFSIIQAQSFVVTHNKILQKIPKKKKPKKQLNPLQIQKKVKKISEPPLPKSSSKIKIPQKKSKSQSKSKNQNTNQNNQLVLQKQSIKKQQNSHPSISLDFLLQQYCRVQEQNQLQNQDSSNTFMKRQKSININQNYRQDSSARSTISVQKTKRSRSKYDIESNYNKYSQKLDDEYNNFFNIYQNQPSQHHSTFSSKNNNNLNSQLKKQQIQQSIAIQLQSMIRKELQQLRYIEPEKDEFCINVLCRDQKILSYVKKMNEKYYKRQNFKTYYFNLINQPEFTDKVNRNQMFRQYFQIEKRQYLQMLETKNTVEGDSQQQRMVVKRALYEIRQKLGSPQILYLCNKNCKLDCLYAQLSPLPKNQIVDFNIIKAIADLNSKIIHDYQYQNRDEAVKKVDQKTNIIKPFVYMKITELYLVKTIINFDLINEKRLTILDSTILKSSLEYIIQRLGGILVLPLNYLLGRQKCDVVITAKRSIKIQESCRKKRQIQWFVDVQRFIDCLIKVQV